MTPTEIFVAKAQTIHGSEYDYSLTMYQSAKCKIDVLCLKHGIFSITPNNHLRGVRCRKCSMGELGMNKRKTTETFVSEASAKHIGKYSYSKSIYTTAIKPLIIECSKHGEFLKTPNAHLAGQGCPRCADRYKMQNNWLSYLGVPDTANSRQVSITLPSGDRIVADGYDPNTNTIYEFWGDKWHGNLSRLDPNDINPRTKLSYKEHYDRTVEKVEKIKSAGYNLVQIWESQWLTLLRTKGHEINVLFHDRYSQPTVT